MPLSPNQIKICQILASNRNEHSFIAGGVAIDSFMSFRLSEDIDIFHDRDNVLSVFAADRHVLEQSNFEIETRHVSQSFCSALVMNRDGCETTILDWAQDSRFRFFPPEKDDLLGFKLHMADLAINKISALTSRREVRDLIDAILIDQLYCPIGAFIFALPAIDTGFSPKSAIDMIRYTARYNLLEVERAFLAMDIQWDPQSTLVDFREKLQIADEWLAFPPVELAGSLFLDKNGNPCTPECFDDVTIRPASAYGLWPRDQNMLSDLVEDEIVYPGVFSLNRDRI